MKIAIIEPHYDDCWLNVGGLMLRNPQHDYKVISISKDDNWGNNVNNTKKLAKYIPNLESVEFRYNSLDVNVEHVKQQMKNEGITTLDELFVIINNLTHQSEYMERTEEAIQECEGVFLPLGTNHPMHILMGDWTFDKPTLRYQEYPYAYYKEEIERLKELTKDIVKLGYDISEVIEKKEMVFREIYASEIFVLDLPECTKKLSELNQEFFYSKKEGGEKIWSALV